MWCNSKKNRGSNGNRQLGKMWTPLLGKTAFTAQEGQRLTLGIRLAKTPSEEHGG